MTLLGIAALVLLFSWVFGGALLRLGGLLLVLAGVLSLASSGNPDGVLVAAIGTVLWFLGHGHYALRHGAWKSRLAALVWSWAGAAVSRLVGVGPARSDPCSGVRGELGQETREVDRQV